MDDLWWARTRPQNPVRHHPWLDKVVRILDGHLVNNFITLPSQLLNDVQVGGVKQAAASEPSGVVEVGGIDHQRVALPFTDRKPVVIIFDRFLALSAVGRDVAVFEFSAAVIATASIEEDDVSWRLDNAVRGALPREPQRLTGHNWIVLVRPLIEFLSLVPKLGFVHRMARPKPRGRDPLIIHPEVVLRRCAADADVDSATRHLRWTAATGATARNCERRRTPVSCQIRMSVGQPRGYGGGRRLPRGCGGIPGAVGRLIGWLNRGPDACRNPNHYIHLSGFRQGRRNVTDHRAILFLDHPARVERLRRIQRIVPVFIVAVGELVSLRSLLHDHALRHELFVERRGCDRVGNAGNRERHDGLIAFPRDGGFPGHRDAGRYPLRPGRHFRWIAYPRHRALERTLRTCPQANHPFLYSGGHRRRLAFTGDELDTRNVFVPGIRSTEDFDIGARLPIGPSARVLNPLA